ncbi:MAG TPA: hypothetical protein VGM19_13245 [Armatimonadota bacterium]|jgi:hypothetical protein
MRATLYSLLTLSVLATVLAGCGGSSSTPALPAEPARSAQVITKSPGLDSLAAALTAAGKPLPDFLQSGTVTTAPPPGSVSTQSYMTVLTLNRWLYNQSVTRGRTQWYEVSLTSLNNLTDAYALVRSGDADLYVFSPIRPNDPNSSLQLVGYSVGTGNEQVGSWVASAWGGTGRYIIGVNGFQASTFDLKVW